MAKVGVIDLCCGMGGLSFAAKEAGLSIWAGVDTSQSALRSYAGNFRRASRIPGDVSDPAIVSKCLEVRDSRARNQERFIVLSGPPCQGFSDAGPRQSGDARNDVLVAVAQAIARLKPEAAIVENVPALRKPKNSAILRRFRSVLNKAGYHVRGIELDAVMFGVPQNRRRLMFFITSQAVPRHRITKELRAFHKNAKSVREAIGDLPVPPLWHPKRETNKDAPGVSNHYAMRHSERVRAKISAISPGKGPLSYRKLNPDAFAPTLLSGHRAPPVHYEQARSITVREALRLQGFPDRFRVRGAFANQMEQVTNAVPAPLGNAAVKTLSRLMRRRAWPKASKEL